MSWPYFYSEALTNTQLTYIANNITTLSATGNINYSPLLKSAAFTPGTIDLFITNFINRFLLKPLGASLPSGYVELFNAHGANIIADRSVLALLIGSIIFIALQVNRFWVSALYIGVYLFIVRLTGTAYIVGTSGGDMLFALLSGGTLLAAFFLLGDTSTGAKTKTGIAVSSCLCAVLTWFFRFIENEPYGAFYAVLFLNVLTSLIRNIEMRLFYEKRNVL
jgi:electron transport complex protein RnfD